MAPSIMEVRNGDSMKTMAWPLVYAPPGSESPPKLRDSLTEKLKDPFWQDCEIITFPSTVVAVGSFADASVEPVVRRVDKELRHACARDGIRIAKDSASSVKFAQYDAIFSMGKRRGEVWIDLQDANHPW